MKILLAPARACALLLALALVLSALHLQSAMPSMVAAQSVTPAGALSELAIDDGSAECVLGLSMANGTPGFGWANKLTPASYPATLRSMTIGFSRNAMDNSVKRDALFRIVVYIDPEKDGPGGSQPPDAAFIGRVRGDLQSIQTYNLVTPLTIQQGSFVIGVVDEFGIANFPALYDVPGKSNPPGSESFTTFNGGASWQKFSDTTFPGMSFCEHPGSFLIRATVESGAVDAITTTKITDPLAVEPWGVSAGSGLAIVTNYASDNLTVIKTSDNSFQNVPIGDGPGGAPDGPFGVVGPVTITTGNLASTRAYVTLFGSNTIPSKEFPIDYSTVGPGRVVVLNRSADTLVPAVTINVGKGPRFPALVTTSTAKKLYVPCGGANRVDVIDTATNQKVAEIAVGLDPSSCAVSLNNTKVYVTNFGDGSISVIDTKTDTKIKDIPAPRVSIPSPVGSTGPPASPLLTNPWNSVFSQSTGNLYVTYWGTEDDQFPNGAITEFDTCKEEFVRATLDYSTRGTPRGSNGATGLPAPTAPLTLDSMTGKTPEAGGGGGGPFGIAACDPVSLVFTNDAAGVVGVLDPRVDQVVTAPPIALVSCPKPRAVACLITQTTRSVLVACGQPDNSVMQITVPPNNRAIADLPVIDFFASEFGNKIKIRGSGFTEDATLEFVPSDSPACLTFERKFKVKKSGKLIEQKGNLSDGSKPKNRPGFFRLVNPDGTIQLIASFLSTSTP